MNPAATRPGPPAQAPRRSATRRRQQLAAACGLVVGALAMPLAAVAVAPTPTAAAALARLPSWTQPLADGVRTLDFRNGIPDALQGRGFTPGSYVLLANPYLPADRRVLLEAQAMACHPQGGVVVWARMSRFDGSKPEGRRYVDGAEGAYRMEADGRVTPLAARPEAETRGPRQCDAPLEQTYLPDWNNITGLLVEPAGDVLLAASGAQAVLRFRTDGSVQRVAGGGADLCSRPGYDGGERGWRDGSGADALFNGALSMARAADGTIYVGESGFLSSGGAWNAGNCSIRRIAPDGRVSTIFGSGHCETSNERARAAATTSVEVDRLALDRSGQLLVTGSRRGPWQGRGDGIFTKAFRIDPATGSARMIGFAARAQGTPQGWFAGTVGIAPDGTPVAFDDPAVTVLPHAGLVRLDRPESTLHYWWPARPGWVDGRDAAMQGVRDFCSAVDGSVYFLGKGWLRRLDPRTGQVTTWLH